MNQATHNTAAAAGTASLLAILLLGVGRMFNEHVEPEMATAVAALLSPFVGLLYARLGVSPPNGDTDASPPPAPVVAPPAGSLQS